MSFLKKLFGGSGDVPRGAEPEVYNDYLIYAEPTKEAGGYRITARIEKTFGDETKSHTMIRADTVSDHSEAIAATIHKAKHVIDQQGDRIF